LYVSSTDLSAIQQHFNSLSQSKSTSASIDYAEFQITGTASSLAKGVKHFWVEQLYQGIPIINSNYKISLKNGQLNHTIDQFITGLDKMTK